MSGRMYKRSRSGRKHNNRKTTKGRKRQTIQSKDGCMKVIVHD